MSKTKAYSYVRFSSALQAQGDSRRRQSQGAIDYAQQKDLDLVETFEDMGVSAFRGKQLRDGQLGVFRDLVERGKIERGSHLIVESLDRLSRASPIKALGLFSQILGQGIVIATLFDNQVYTEERLEREQGALFLGLGAMIRAHDESRTKSERLKAVWEQKRKLMDVRKLTRTCPAWLKVSGDYQQFELIPERVEVVRQIFSWACSGYGNFTIARKLTAEGIAPWGPTRKGKTRNARIWMESYVTKILQNRAVLGEAQFHRYEHVGDIKQRVAALEPRRDYYPAIIAEETFLKAQAERKLRRVRGAGRKGAAVTCLFSGIVFCGACGAPVWYVNKGASPKGGQHLRCSTARGNGRCSSFPWRYSDLEDRFLEVVRQLDVQDVIAAAQTDKQLAARAKLNAIDAEITRVSLEIERLVKLLAKHGDLPEADTELATLSASRSRLNADRETLKAEVLPSEPEQVKSALFALKERLASLHAAQATEELGALRTSLSAELKRAIHRIELHTNEQMLPPEVDEEALQSRTKFPPAFRDKLGRDWEYTVADVQRILTTPYGRRLYAESQRQFTIRYKNGAVQVVKPSLGINYFLDHEVRFKKLRRPSSESKT